MKTRILLAAMMMATVMIFPLTSQSQNKESKKIQLEGDSNSPVGRYQIMEIPSETINGETYRTFELTYEKGNKPVKIYLDERSRCRDYIVRSQKNEVRYVCKKSSFGAQLVTAKFESYNPDVNSYFTNQLELANQEKITDGKLPISEALGLIACYYPSLVKNPLQL